MILQMLAGLLLIFLLLIFTLGISKLEEILSDSKKRKEEENKDDEPKGS